MGPPIWWAGPRNAATSFDIYGTRVTPQGVVLDLTGIALSTAPDVQYGTSVASNGSDFLVTWQDARTTATTSWDIYGTRVTAEGLVQDPGGLALSTAPDSQSGPSVASSGSEYLVTWVDFRDQATTNGDIYATRVTAAGMVRNAGGIVISAAIHRELNPSVNATASNGSYLIVYESQDRIAARFYRTCGDGLIEDGEGCDDGGINGGDGCARAVRSRRASRARVRRRRRGHQRVRHRQRRVWQR